MPAKWCVSECIILHTDPYVVSLPGVFGFIMLALFTTPALPNSSLKPSYTRERGGGGGGGREGGREGEREGEERGGERGGARECVYEREDQRNETLVSSTGIFVTNSCISFPPLLCAACMRAPAPLW